MHITVELMKEEHLDQVAEIEAVSFPAPWSRRSFADELSNNLACYIVVINDNYQVAGYGGMWLVFDEAQITNVAVRPEMRGAGVGKTLMLCLINQAALSGCRNMYLEVRPSNQIARNMYESLGFVEIGYRKKYYADSGEDAIIMRRGGYI